MEPKALQKAVGPSAWPVLVRLARLAGTWPGALVVKVDCPARVREAQAAWAVPAWAQLVAGHAREGARQAVRAEPRAAPLLQGWPRA